ncbi:hypothetical protein M514_24485 [Trichuris suis]|uniref:HTH psq-type domain-containing protein n=1 Tax=Trichuris suis TaxID=68888 RepID=A0A085N1F9_9BILA|nr:hypothetical protein M514_24485 [Trichuris suis]
MAPKRKTSSAGTDDKPKRSRDVLSISEKVRILDLVEKEGKSYAAVAKTYGKNESSIREIVKNKDKIRSSFNAAPQTAKVTSISRDKILVKMEKALNFWVEDMNRKSIPVNGQALRQKALDLYEHMRKKQDKEGTQEEAKPFIAGVGNLRPARAFHPARELIPSRPLRQPQACTRFSECDSAFFVMR